MDNLTRRQYLQAMGIELWQLRGAAPEMALVEIDNSIDIEIDDFSVNQSESPDTGQAIQSESHIVNDDNNGWSDLQAEVVHCTKCGLCETRTQTVFGSGNQQADWMLIGEAPGQSEDQQGLPFVGKAGLLLTEMLRSIGLARETVYIANILKCRPPNNRDPKPNEIDSCNQYLQRQINLVQPKILLAVGRIAAQALLKTDQPIGKLRGKVHTLGTTPVVVVYHPAYLLRSLLEKRKAWQDLLFAMQQIKK